MSLDVLFWRFYSADYRGGSRRSNDFTKTVLRWTFASYNFSAHSTSSPCLFSPVARAIRDRYCAPIRWRSANSSRSIFWGNIITPRRRCEQIFSIQRPHTTRSALANVWMVRSISDWSQGAEERIGQTEICGELRTGEVGVFDALGLASLRVRIHASYGFDSSSQRFWSAGWWRCRRLRLKLPEEPRLKQSLVAHA
jgi:hypothetical protein